jgi:hypothetical protein
MIFYFLQKTYRRCDVTIDSKIHINDIQGFKEADEQQSVTRTTSVENI